MFLLLVLCRLCLTSSPSLESWENPMSMSCQHLYYKHQGTFGVIKTDICCRKYSCTIWQINEGRRVLYTCINSNYIAQITTFLIHGGHLARHVYVRLCASLDVLHSAERTMYVFARERCAREWRQRLLVFFWQFLSFLVIVKGPNKIVYGDKITKN